jgi:uncharacterized spore protein YtfJ
MNNRGVEVVVDFFDLTESLVRSLEVSGGCGAGGAEGRTGTEEKRAGAG